MALTDKLSAIADAIREKTGNTSPLYLDSMPSYIRSIQTTSSDNAGIPDYVLEEGKRVASGMLAKRGANSITAVLLSDSHDLGDNDSDAATISLTRKGNQEAGQGAKVIADNIDLDFVAHLGDFCFGAKTSTISDFVQGIVNAKSYIHDVAKDHETFFTPGNHDTGTYGFAQNGEYLSQGVLDALIGTYRYVDFTKKKVRVICLNTAEVEGLTVSGASGTHRITGTQLQWFANALDLSSKSDAASWGIVIMAHAPLDWDSATIPAANCLQAYLTGGSYSVTHNGVAVSKNFSGKNAAKVICQLHGHVHGFRVDEIRYNASGTLKSTGIKRIAIPNTYTYRNNEYGENSGVDSNGLEFGETTTYKKTPGTAQSTAFCLVSIDLDKEIIYADCYGAGYDRVISYADEVIVTYSVTNNIPGATNSNGSTTVVEGSSYSASISPLVDYEINTIKVTMGGVDITSTAVSGNNITIPNVTGDIIIIVTTIIVEDFDYGEFTNLVPLSQERSSTAIYNGVGYKNGVYCTDSGDTAASGIVSTGYIPYTWDPSHVLYIKGATLDTSTESVRIYGFASKTTMNNNVGYTSGSRITERFTVETLGDKYYKLTPKTATNATLTYIRISLVGTGENLIVTVNEQIHAEVAPTSYSVTQNLAAQITSSNNATSATAGGSWSTTLSVAGGYQFDSVSVTMGGKDVTASAYSNGVVTISNVTGAIVVNATVKVASTGYTNLVPTLLDLADPTSGKIFNSKGYMDGMYLSTTAPYYNTDAARVVTGFLPYTKNTQKPIYIKGVTFGTASHDRFGYRDSNYAGVRSTPNFGESPFTDCFAVEQLGTNYFKFTPISNTSTIESKMPRMTHVAFSFVGVGANLIITVGEPIE